MNGIQRVTSLLIMTAVLTACGNDPAGSTEKESGQAQQSTNPGDKSSHDGHQPKKHTGQDGHREENRSIHLEPSQLARLDIRVEQVKTGAADALIKAPATVRFDPDRVVTLGPRLRAKIIEVKSDLGEPVEQGEAVAVLDSVALGKAKARHLTTKARVRTARAAYEREKTLASQEISSEAELLEARAKMEEARAEHQAADEELRLYGLSPEAIDAVEPGGKVPLSRYRLTSPVKGVVQKRDVSPGQTIGPEQTPIHIVDTSRMWVMMEAFERDLPRLSVGQRVSFAPRALRDHAVAGKIDWISRELDQETRTIRVRATVDNPDGLLRAGMFGTARIQTLGATKQPLVPVDAVQRIEDGQFVFVPGEKDGHFRAVPVRLGTEANGRVEVVSGLAADDKVVVAGAFDLMSALTASGRSASHGH